ncbi:MAG: hypothetical protein NT103_08355 [Campylobacterales bacterium]|nr:hypothetical protein [Campylobacterales bacterium]
MRLYLLLTLLAVDLLAGGYIARCNQYTQEVRRAHWSQFGVDYPYQYGVGQLVQESGCRNIISLDGVGSEGLPQITYRVWQQPLKAKGVTGITAIGDQLKAQAIIMKSCHDGNQYKKLWIAYQVYNGGGLVKKEIKRAGIVDWEKAKASCNRGQSCFTYKGVKTCRSNCDINYEYSQNIFKYGGKYGSIIESSQYRYW